MLKSIVKNRKSRLITTPDVSLKKVKQNIRNEIKGVQKKLKAIGLLEQMHRLHNARPLVSLTWMLRDFLILFFFTFILQFDAIPALIRGLMFPPILLVFGSRLRAIYNVCHDVVHYNVFRSRRRNEIFAKFFIFPFSFWSYILYWSDHHPHHFGLGTCATDPEKICKSIEVQKATSSWSKFKVVYFSLFFDKKTWLSSLYGDFFTSRKNFFSIFAWWSAFFVMLYLVLGASFAITFIGLVFLSRATTYHSIKVFCELVDHFGKCNDSIVNYTRTMPKTWLTWFIHSNNDRYHTAHHLLSGIPMPNLKKAHKLLMFVSEYRESEFVSNYFIGRNNMIESLTQNLEA